MTEKLIAQIWLGLVVIAFFAVMGWQIGWWAPLVVIGGIAGFSLTIGAICHVAVD